MICFFVCLICCLCFWIMSVNHRKVFSVWKGGSLPCETEIPLPARDFSPSSTPPNVVGVGVMLTTHSPDFLVGSCTGAVNLSLSLSVFMSVCLSLCLTSTVCLNLCSSVCLFVCHSLSLSLALSLSLSLSLSHTHTHTHTHRAVCV